MKTSLAIVLATALSIRCDAELYLRRRGPELGNLWVRWAYPLSRSRSHYPRPRAQALIVAIVRL